MAILQRLWLRLFGPDAVPSCKHHWHTESVPHRTCEKPNERELIHQCCHCGEVRDWDF